ncbi:IPT/TIG domain-containing protein [Pontiella agarivorans]|uniref:IPT/TIG domain-containing protein n=1 Tax=Pontiella agarivorans TaxID=3038953 RepID=A0ABU5MXJ2_9BACT|nr:IPT/TIG domain-containing protein [Pontiella agarivorans]MDZ8118691.1 IPT/TIG domain-containing protein [Pontiella agarivorans]
MKAHDAQSTLRKQYINTAVIAAAVAMTTIAHTAELLNNGDFNNVMENWNVEDALGSWIPYEHPDGTVSLSPASVFGYRGTVISQPLNVDGIASQTVDLSIDLGSDWFQNPGNSVAVYLEYIDSSGARQRALALNPDNSAIAEGGMATISTSYTFPADSARLVELAIDLLDDTWSSADNISLSSSSLTPGPIPQLGSITPAALAHGGTLTITGHGFGSAAGEVLIGGSTNGVTVQSWTPDQVTVLIGTACTGGNVMIDSAGTRTCEKRTLSVTSPYYTVDVSPASTIATAGQSVQVGIHTPFRNGFSTAAGIQLSVTNQAARSVLSPNPVMADGGSLLTFDTTGLTPGVHTFTVLGQDGASTDRTAEFSIDIRAVDTLTAVDFSDVSLDGYTFTSGAPASMQTTITDTLGGDISYEVPRPVWSSDNPMLIEVFQETSPWGSLYFLPHANGSTTVRAALPDGSEYPFAVQVALPADPAVVSHSCSFSPMSNDPTETNQLYFLASGPMSGYSYSIGDLGVATHNSYLNGDNSSHTYDFTIGADAIPGTYMFSSSATVGGVTLSDGCLLQVVNNPDTGMIKGHVAQFGGDMMGHGASGELEFYDASSGTLLFTENIWSWTDNYTAPSIPPGVYTLRWNPGSFSSIPPQWFPNADTQSVAAAVTVTAGSTVEEVNFTLSPPDEPVVYPPISIPPAYDSGSGTYSFSVQTTSNTSYQLQKSANLKDGSWFNLESIWGDGSNAQVEDSETAASTGFYRVVPE